MCPVNAIRVAYTGELGWELHHRSRMQNYLFDLRRKRALRMALKLVGARRRNWLRQEKFISRLWQRSLARDATPLEADLRVLWICSSKDFNGKAAMEGPKHPVKMR